jgi:prolyl oligopeptidase
MMIRQLLRLALLLGFCAFAEAYNDRYLWLEDSSSCETKNWLAKQQLKFDSYQQANRYVEKVKATLEDLEESDFPKSYVRIGDKYLLHQKNALYLQNGLEDEPQLLLDIETSFSLVAYVPSPNGELVAYGLSENGSDWTTWHVLDVATATKRLESTGKTKFSTVCWSSDSCGFYYSCFDESDIHGVYYHHLGNAHEQDRLIYRDLEHKSYFYIPRLSSDHRYLMIDIITGSMAPNSFLCLDLEHVESPLINLIPFDGGTHWFVCNRGSKFYFITTTEAPCRKLIALDIQNPTLRHEILPDQSAWLGEVFPIKSYFLVSYLEDGSSRLALYDDEGEEIREIPLPDIGVVKFLHGHPDSHGTRDFVKPGPVLFSFSNFVRPPTLYRFDFHKDEPSIFKKSQIEIDPEDYSVHRIFYPSKDGTRVPLFIVHKKDLELDGKTPTLLYGYGGFCLPNLPIYNQTRMAWLKQGGIIASACIRGGGEYGTKWHLAGVKEKQQNSIDDLIAAAEWLIENQYTTAKKLSLYGFSNSAMLAGACINQRPELFGAVAMVGGVYDMIRYPLFSLGRFWIQEYGNPDEPAELEFIKRYSPYHNVKQERNYPPLLIMTSDMDTRVAPLHSYKYAAALQEAQSGEGKILLRVKHQSGHFADDIDDSADMLAFLMAELQKN